jgi:hypothetical protein
MGVASFVAIKTSTGQELLGTTFPLLVRVPWTCVCMTVLLRVSNVESQIIFAEVDLLVETSLHNLHLTTRQYWEGTSPLWPSVLERWLHPVQSPEPEVVIGMIGFGFNDAGTRKSLSLPRAQGPGRHTAQGRQIGV